MPRKMTRGVFSIVKQPVYQRLKAIRHHHNSIFYHNLRVARVAYRWGKWLGGNSFFRVKHGALIRGAMLHDFFFYDWRRTRPANGKHHAFEHPRESARHASLYYGITERERNMILAHMWPLGWIWPRHTESWIVTLADKWVSIKEFFQRWFGKGRKRV